MKMTKEDDSGEEGRDEGGSQAQSVHTESDPFGEVTAISNLKNYRTI